MTRSLISTVVVLVVLFSVLSSAQTESWQSGKVVAVEKHGPKLPCCYSATDAPLQGKVTIYDISLQIADSVYVGRYESYIDYVPTNWTKDRLVLARLTKHFLYLKTPSSEGTRLSLLSRSRANEIPKKRC